ALTCFAVAAADWRVVYHPAASAAGLVQAAQAVAASLDHLAALAVAAGAGDANALVGRLVLALAHREVAAADGHAVPGATAGTHAAGQHAAQVLHHAARGLVIAGARD